jgi:hypothetical protein
LKKEVCYYENSGTGIYYFKYGMRILDDTSAYLRRYRIKPDEQGTETFNRHKRLCSVVLQLCRRYPSALRKGRDFYKPGTNYGYNPNMNNGYNPNMNNGYNPNMNNGYNANMNNNAYNPNANTGYSNANYAAPVNNTTADTTNNNFNNNGIQQ